MDAFFAAIEQRDHPEYRGRPVIIGAKPGGRGVVSTASYEARTFGVHSAMPIGEAYSRCPRGIFIRPRMSVYASVSRSIMELFGRFSPRVEQVSVDEAFLDMTGTERLFGSALQAARKIATAIRNEHHLTASIGIAPNKFCAKIASDLDKPDGITICPQSPEDVRSWLAPLPVRKIWGVGVKTAAVLDGWGIATIGELQRLSRRELAGRFGKQGEALWQLAQGIDVRPVENGSPCKSISREHTFAADSRSFEEWRSTLFELTQDVARTARSEDVKGATVVLTWRRPDFSRHSRRRTLPQPTNVARFIFDTALELLTGIDEKSLRLLGVGITGLEAPLQMELFQDTGGQNEWEKSEEAVDELTDRFGRNVVEKGYQVERRTKKRGHCQTDT